MGAVALGVTGSTYLSSTKQSDINLSKTLRTISAIIFLVVIVLLLVHTVFLVREESAEHGKPFPPPPSRSIDRRLNTLHPT